MEFICEADKVDAYSNLKKEAVSKCSEVLECIVRTSIITAFSGTNEFFKNIKDQDKQNASTNIPPILSKQIAKNIENAKNIEEKYACFDFQAYFKSLFYVQKNKKTFCAFYRISRQANLDSILLSCMKSRNTVAAHSSLMVLKTISKETTIGFLNSYIKFSSLVKDHSKQLSDLYDELVETYKNYIHKLDTDPINLNALANSPDGIEMPLNTIIEYLTKHNIKIYPNNMVVGISVDEIKQICANEEQNRFRINVLDGLMDLLRDNYFISSESNTEIRLDERSNQTPKASNTDSLNEGDISQDESIQICSEKEIKTNQTNDSSLNDNKDSSAQSETYEPVEVKEFEPFKFLSAYQNGFLKNSQFTELLSNFNIILDLSVLLSKDSRIFIEQQLISRISKMNRPIFISRSIKKEIYDIIISAQNNSNECAIDENTITQAKCAYQLLSSLKAKKMIVFMGAGSVFDNYESEIIGIIQIIIFAYLQTTNHLLKKSAILMLKTLFAQKASIAMSFCLTLVYIIWNLCTL